MKALFISYNQSLGGAVLQILDKNRVKGYTQWNEVAGCGSTTGEPHLGTHTWPAKNTVILSMVPEARVEPIMEALRELDANTEQQGLRAFVWSVEGQL